MRSAFGSKEKERGKSTEHSRKDKQENDHSHRLFFASKRNLRKVGWLRSRGGRSRPNTPVARSACVSARHTRRPARLVLCADLVRLDEPGAGACCKEMLTKAVGILIAAAALSMPCAAWQAGPAGFRTSSLDGGARARGWWSCASSCKRRVCGTAATMVATGSESGSSAAGTVQSYMKKIPPHLQGLAIRNQKQQETDYSSKTLVKNEEEQLAAIQAELDADDEEEEFDHVDYALQALDDLNAEGNAPNMGSFDLDIEDAEVLRSLRDKLHNEDFKHIFGRGVGELL